VPHYLNRPLYQDRPLDGGGTETRERKKKSRRDSCEDANVTTCLFLRFGPLVIPSVKKYVILTGTSLKVSISFKNGR